MFFDIRLLCPQYKGKFALAWIAATRGINKLSKKQVLSVDVQKLCEDIREMFITENQKPNGRLSLSLTAKLVNGTIKIHFAKAQDLYKLVQEYMTSVPRVFIADLEKTVVKVKGQRKRREVLSDEVVPLRERRAKVAPAAEPVITDLDLEKILKDKPVATTDSITLREEMPRILPPDEGRFGVGDLSDVERYLLDHDPPTTEAEKLKFQELISRTQLQDSESETIPKAIEEGPPSKRPRIEQIIENHEQLALPPQQPVVEEIQVMQDIQEQQEVQTITELPVVQMEVERAAEEQTPGLIPKPTKTRKSRKRNVNLSKILIKIKTRRVRRIMRCNQEDNEIYQPKSYEPIQLELARFDDIYEDADYMGIMEAFIRDPLLEGLRNLESQRDSRITEESVSRLSKLSGTSTAPIPSRSVQELREEQILATPPALVQADFFPARRTMTPVMDIDVSELTEIHTERGLRVSTLETVVEDVPPADTTISTRNNVNDIEIIAPQEKHPISSGEFEIRLKEVLKVIKNWDFEERDLTIEDVSRKPINRVNVSVAFSDLLHLHKLEYVLLIKEVNSSEEWRIIKGKKLLAKS